MKVEQVGVSVVAAKLAAKKRALKEAKKGPEQYDYDARHDLTLTLSLSLSLSLTLTLTLTLTRTRTLTLTPTPTPVQDGSVNGSRGAGEGREETSVQHSRGLIRLFGCVRRWCGSHDSKPYVWLEANSRVM
jgi:hypothetical protein